MSLHIKNTSLRNGHERLNGLRSRRLEAVGARENGSAGGRHARGEGAPSPLACLLLAHPFILAPTTSRLTVKETLLILMT